MAHHRTDAARAGADHEVDVLGKDRAGVNSVRTFAGSRGESLADRQCLPAGYGDRRILQGGLAPRAANSAATAAAPRSAANRSSSPDRSGKAPSLRCNRNPIHADRWEARNRTCRKSSDRRGSCRFLSRCVQPLLCRPRRLPCAPISPVVSAASPATGSNPPPAVHCLGRALSVSARLPGEGPGVRAVFLPNSAFRIPDLPPACVPLALPVPFASAFRLSFILHPCVPVSVTGPVTLPRIRHRPCDDPRPRAPPHRTRRVRRTLILPRVAALPCQPRRLRRAPIKPLHHQQFIAPVAANLDGDLAVFARLESRGGASPVSVTGPVTLPRIRHTPCDDPRPPRDCPLTAHGVCGVPSFSARRRVVNSGYGIPAVVLRRLPAAPNLSCCVSRVACDAPNQAPSPPAVHCPGRR